MEKLNWKLTGCKNVDNFFSNLSACITKNVKETLEWHYVFVFVGQNILLFLFVVTAGQLPFQLFHFFLGALADRIHCDVLRQGHRHVGGGKFDCRSNYRTRRILPAHLIEQTFSSLIQLSEQTLFEESYVWYTSLLAQE